MKMWRSSLPIVARVWAVACGVAVGVEKAGSQTQGVHLHEAELTPYGENNKNMGNVGDPLMVTPLSQVLRTQEEFLHSYVAKNGVGKDPVAMQLEELYHVKVSSPISVVNFEMVNGSRWTWRCCLSRSLFTLWQCAGRSSSKDFTFLRRMTLRLTCFGGSVVDLWWREVASTIWKSNWSRRARTHWSLLSTLVAVDGVLLSGAAPRIASSPPSSRNMDVQQCGLENSTQIFLLHPM